MTKKLTNRDYCDAAELIGCKVSTIKAVAKVESGGRGGFDAQGRVLIRFEGHKFRAFTNKRFDRSNSGVSYPYHRTHKNCGKNHGYGGFNEAFQLDPTAAMLATSYGMFQPMGFNHEEMGYETVGEMLDDFKKGEREQLLAFCRLIKKWGLADELKRAQAKDFAVFAKRYNGADYATNNYDGKMLAYKREFDKEKIDCSRIPAAAAVEEQTPFAVGENDAQSVFDFPQTPEIPNVEEMLPDLTDQVKESVGTVQETVRETIEDGQKQIEKETTAIKNTFDPETYTQYIPQIGKARRWLGGGFLLSLLSTFGAKFAGLPDWMIFVLGFVSGIIAAGLVWLFVSYYKQVFALVQTVVKSNADPAQNNFVLTSDLSEFEKAKLKLTAPPNSPKPKQS